MTLDVMEFIRRFLQHVLPAGFMKVRYFGFMNPNCQVELGTISALIEQSYDFDSGTQPKTELEPWRPITCPHCGGTLKLCAIVLPNGMSIGAG